MAVGFGCKHPLYLLISNRKFQCNLGGSVLYDRSPIWRKTDKGLRRKRSRDSGCTRRWYIRHGNSMYCWIVCSIVSTLEQYPRRVFLTMKYMDVTGSWYHEMGQEPDYLSKCQKNKSHIASKQGEYYYRCRSLRNSGSGCRLRRLQKSSVVGSGVCGCFASQCGTRLRNDVGSRTCLCKGRSRVSHAWFVYTSVMLHRRHAFAPSPWCW